MSEPTTPESNVPDNSPVDQDSAPSVAASTETIRTGIRPRTAKRLAIMSIILLVFVSGGYWFIGLKGDIQLDSNTASMIGAMNLQEQGSQAVVIDPQGKITGSSGYVAGKSDRDLAWDPRGNRLFFISDRKDESFHIYRWDPQRDKIDQKSVDKAGRSNLVFDAQDKGTGELVGLVLVRGTVQQFTPKTAKSQQVMPPPKKVDGGPENGSASTFDLVYKRYGVSFKSARWFGNRRYIAAVMRREDKGESLIIQDSEPDEKGEIKPPQLMLIAERFNLAVDPKTGNLVFSVTDVLPILDKDGKPTTDADGNPTKYPFSHAILELVVADGKFTMQPIGASPNKELCFVNPVVSPDGSSLMFLVGKYAGEGNMAIQSLGSCPLTSGGIQSASPISQGNISDPSFSPDGRKIAYVKQEGGHQAIFIASSDGSGAKNLTGSVGDFASPIFSPQFK